MRAIILSHWISQNQHFVSMALGILYKQRKTELALTHYSHINPGNGKIMHQCSSNTHTHPYILLSNIKGTICFPVWKMWNWIWGLETVELMRFPVRTLRERLDCRCAPLPTLTVHVTLAHLPCLCRYSCDRFNLNSPRVIKTALSFKVALSGLPVCSKRLCFVCAW